MSATIRDASPVDVPAITAIYAAEVLGQVNTYEYDPPDAIEMARRMGAVLDAGYPYLVAEDAGWDGDAMEAEGFAYLAMRARKGLPLSLPTTTGVPQPVTGGRLHRA